MISFVLYLIGALGFYLYGLLAHNDNHAIAIFLAVTWPIMIPTAVWVIIIGEFCKK